MKHLNALIFLLAGLLSLEAGAQPNLILNGDLESLALDEFDEPLLDAYGNTNAASWFRRQETPASTPVQPVPLLTGEDSDGVGSRAYALNYYEVSVGSFSFPGVADVRSYAFEAIAGETLTWSFDYKLVGVDQLGGDEFRADLRFFEDLSPTNPSSTGSSFIFEDQYYSGVDSVADGEWVTRTRQFVVPFDSPESSDDDMRPAPGTVLYGDVRISVNAFTAFNGGQVVLDNFIVTRPVSADFNGDGLVDAADYTIWRDTANSTTDLRADANGDGLIDGLDYNRWTSEYGSIVPPSFAVSVPEPNGILLLCVGAVGLVSRRLR